MTETRSIVFQGEPGANSHIACVDNYPDLTPAPARPSRTPSPRFRRARPISA